MKYRWLLAPLISAIAAAPCAMAAEAANADAAHIVAELRMVSLKAADFQMGAPNPQDILDGAPQHKVTLRGFRIAAFDVTFDAYDKFARATGRALPDDEGWGRGNRPVINVTWADTQDFIAWLNRIGLRHFRLPSEAEWEYAARGGKNTDYWWGPRMDPNFANTQIGGGRDIWPHTSPVGSFPANPYGLYDMQGNVAQRVEDCYHHSYAGAPADGSAWVLPPCDARVVRGGSWFTLSRASKVTARAAAGEDFASMALGFRLAEDDGPGRNGPLPR